MAIGNLNAGGRLDMLAAGETWKSGPPLPIELATRGAYSHVQGFRLVALTAAREEARMKLRERLTYANVMATVAVFLALGGGAWALARDRVGSGAIKNNSIRSNDIHNRTIRAHDVRRNSLRGGQINESTLDASAFTRGTSAAGPISCDPTALPFIDCASAHLRLPRRAGVLLIATGGEESVGGPAEAQCRLLVDGLQISGATTPPTILPGEAVSDNTDAAATNDFAIAAVSDRLARGGHDFSLSCDQGSGNVKIDSPNIAVVMIGPSGLGVP